MARYLGGDVQGAGVSGFMNHPLRLVFCGIWAFLLTVPWLLFPIYGLQQHDTARIAQLILAWSGALMLLLSKGQALALWWPRSKLMQLMVITTITLSFLAVLTAPSPTWSFKELMTWVSFLVLALVVHSQIQTERDFKRFSQILALALMFGSLQCILSSIFLMLGTGKLEFDSVAMGYINHRFLNHVQTVAIPLSVLVLLPSVNMNQMFKKAAYAGSAVAWALLIFTQGRATILGLLLGSLCLGLIFGRRAILVLRPMGISLFLGIIVFLVIFLALPHLLGIPSDWNGGQHALENTDSGRLRIWRMAWEMFLAHPWLGGGPMQLANHVIHDHAPNIRVAHPHNIYLQGLAEWGGLFTSLIVALVLRLIWRLYSVTKTAGNNQGNAIGFERSLLLLLALIAALTDAAFSGNFVMPVSAVWLSVLFGFTGASIQSSNGLDSQCAKETFNWRLLLAAGVFLLFSVFMFNVLTTIVHEMPTINRSADRRLPISPRFWMNGWW